MQKELDKSRGTEWQKWRKFNAGVILTKKEVRKAEKAGIKILPMQWIETDKNAHKRRNNDYKKVPLLQSRVSLDAVTLRTLKDSEQTALLLMQIRTTLSQVGVRVKG